MSHSYEDAPWWLDVYRKAFPTLVAAVSVRRDGWAQRGGIDRMLTLQCGRTIAIDEKVREKDYGDILLERWSDHARREPGWIQKPLACEFIAYAVIPTQRCWLLPTLSLQRAWRLFGREWDKKYPTCRSANEYQGRKWTTVSIAIPTSILFGAITDAMLVEWSSATSASADSPEPPSYDDVGPLFSGRLL